MKLSELSIRRPVLAVVMTLVLGLFGILSFTKLPVREYPDIEPPMVSVRAVYPGASARVVETDVTTVLEEALTGIESLRTVSSISREEVSHITMEFSLSRDLDGAANDVRDRVFGARRQLPAGMQEPVVWKASGDAAAILWLSLHSDRHSELEITDFAERYIKDRLTTLPGVSTVWTWGARRYAMRIWLDADRLASRRLTVQDVENALRSQNIVVPSGRIESDLLEFSVRTRGELHTAQHFNDLIIAYRDRYPVRLQDVGHAELGAEDDRKLVRLNGQPTVGLGVVKQSKANTLAVARAVKDRLPEIEASLPHGMSIRMAFDTSHAIERSLQEVYSAMAISLLLVVLVIYLFLSSARATVIPVVAIPASILGTFTLMHALGFSINVLTLLGLVLAVGLVVDDAIVVLENIHRRIELGQPPLQAALDGSREIGFAVVATTLSLVAVFIPIGFLTGAIGRLFSELALAVAGSVLISGFVALTLTPMMSAALLRPVTTRSVNQNVSNAPTYPAPEGRFAFIVAWYRRLLTRALAAPSWSVAAATISVLACVALFTTLRSEMAPIEDSGSFQVFLTAPEGATIRYTDQYAHEIETLLEQIPEVQSYWTSVASGQPPALVTQGGSWVTLKDWNDRRRSQQAIVSELNAKLSRIPGVTAAALAPPPLGSATLNPIQLVIGGGSYEDLDRYATSLREKVKAYPAINTLEPDLTLYKPELDVHVHRNKAADLGISVAHVGQTLETLLGGRSVTTFIREGKEYPVIVKIEDRDRVRPSDINDLYMRGHAGELIQLGNLASIEETVAPRELNHYDRMRSVTLNGGLQAGAALGDALDYLETTARDVLPSGTAIRFSGASRQFREAQASLSLTFFVAFLVIYLVLAAEFESFLHPLTILLTVPPAVTGALLTLLATGGTLNIYSQIGLIMLIGLVSKNAILIVDVANQLRARGRDAVEAAIEAAALRLRPILMTTLATVLGAVPLALATGAGSAGRRQLGYAIVGGMLFSTALTLVLVPAVYSLLSRKAAGGTLKTATLEPPAPGAPRHASPHRFIVGSEASST